ncbi:MAG: hypothetical protein JWP39_3453 [Jatrophihabitans sp.]|nr:hypothetical protein [Jatrophihabitans sp.]
MRALMRRLGLLTVVVMSIVLLAPGVPDAAGAVGAGPSATVGGFGFSRLPAGLGARSDFVYDYDDVDFTSAVWETGPDADGGYRVDLDITVMHGIRLSSPRALQDWFIAYEERPPAEARYVPVRIHGRRGWVSRDEVFWLVRPGVALAVRLDGARWTRSDVLRVARSGHELQL